MNAQSHILSELRQLPLNFGACSSTFLDEAAYALQPQIHEGHVVPCGFVSACDLSTLGDAATLVRDEMPLEVARRFADGSNAFVALENGEYAGLVILQRPCSSEQHLIQLQESTGGGIVAVTSHDGRTTFVTPDGIAVHQLRRWRTKPTIDLSVRALQKRAFGVNVEHFRQILAFCYHTLSPTNTGATLVWYVEPASDGAFQSARPPHTTHKLSLNLARGNNLSLAHAILARNDGAALVAPDGQVIGVGAHLIVSPSSQIMIAAAPGTRHTSARRYSYDWPEAVIIVVSSDGPVSVFSDGAVVTHLWYWDPESAARIIGGATGADDDQVGEYEGSLVCDRCGKTSVVYCLHVRDYADPETAYCEVCGNLLASKDAFELSATVIKRIRATDYIPGEP